MKVISFIEDHKVIDKIINHLKLTFKAERPSPPKTQLNMAAEDRGDLLLTAYVFSMYYLDATAQRVKT